MSADATPDITIDVDGIHMGDQVIGLECLAPHVRVHYASGRCDEITSVTITIAAASVVVTDAVKKLVRETQGRIEEITCR